MARQMGLFDARSEEGRGQHIIADDASGAIIYYPGIFAERASAELFERLHAEVPWQQQSRRMYDTIVEVPRLTAHYGDLHRIPEPLQTMRVRVEELLRVAFRSVGVNLYRDGSDSVAWHNDDIALYGSRSVVALVSLGAAREMLLRRKATRRALHLDLEPGSLLVMSGASQEHWEHHIPKVARLVKPRISVAFRTSLHG